MSSKSGLSLAREINASNRPRPRYKTLGAQLPAVRLAPPPIPEDRDERGLQGVVLLGYVGLVMGFGLLLARHPQSAPICLGAGLLAAALIYFVFVVSSFLVTKGALGWLALIMGTGAMVLFATVRPDAPPMMRATAVFFSSWPLWLGVGFVARAVGGRFPKVFGILPLAGVAAVAFVVATALDR